MNDIVALDFETYLMSEGNNAPKPVVLSVYDGKDGYLFTNDSTLETVLKSYLTGEYKLVFHNAAFDLSIIAIHFPRLVTMIFDLLANGLVSDTLIREKLYQLSTIGSIPPRTHGLDKLVLKYLKEDISASKKGPDIWRLRYSELDGVPLSEWPSEAKNYALADTLHTYKVWQAQEELRRETGYGSINTELVQVAADFCLKLATIGGIGIDQNRLESIANSDLLEYNLQLGKLVDMKLASMNKKGKIKKETKKIREYIATNYKGETNTTAKTGKVSTRKADLAILIGKDDGVLQTLEKVAELHKNCTTYYPALAGKTRIYPQYDILKETGRTSSMASKEYGSINIQNQPRREGIRECFVPKADNIFIASDYVTMELAMVGQQCLNKFGSSELADRYNEGKDIHSLTGSIIMGIEYDDFCRRLEAKDDEVKKYRSLAKPINLGYPGGMGPKTMYKMALTSHEIDFNNIRQLEKNDPYLWKAHLKLKRNYRKEIEKQQEMEITTARQLKIKKLSKKTVSYKGCLKLYNKKNVNMRALRGEAIASCFRTIFLTTYPEIPKFFKRLNDRFGYIPEELRDIVQSRHNYTVNGRFRNHCNFTACANGELMQSPGADCAKIAIFYVTQACYDKDSILYDSKMVVFNHDEIIIETKNENVDAKMEALASAMIEGAREWAKDIKIRCEVKALERWSKDNYIIKEMKYG